MRTSDMIKTFSKFWRAVDLEGQAPVRLTIADVTEELIGRGGRQEVKCFVWFTEHLKGLRLNFTIVKTLEAAYGPDSEGWTGKKVRLSFDPTVMFGGRAVGGVRLETPPGIVYSPQAGGAAWGDVPQHGRENGQGRPPQPIWDEKRQTWVTPQAPAPIAAPAPSRPPPPVWNEATQSWETVSPSTGEIKTGPPATIGARVEAAHPAGAAEDFNDDIPF